MSALRSFFTRTVSVLVFAGLGACGYTCPPGNPLGRFGCHVPCEDLPSLARSRCTVIAADAARDARADVVADASDTGVDTGMRDGSMDDADVEDVPRVDVVDEEGNDASIVDPMLLPPRALAPLSTSTVTSQRPTLRWLNGARADGAVVELSRSRDFMRVEQVQRVSGDRVRLAASLSPGVWFWRLRGRIGNRAEGTEHSPVWQFVVRSVETPIDASWGTWLDVNGDGQADLAAGAPSADSAQGRVDVYYGRASGFAATPSISLRGRATSDRFGSSVSCAGDLNGDGFADLVVASPRANPGGRMGAGAVDVFFGSATGLTAATRRTIEGSAANEGFGSAVSFAGDVNADGFADLIVGADAASPGGRANAGTASIFLGGPGGIAASPVRVLEGASAGDRFGESVTNAGDVTGDGFDDVVVGAASAAPRMVLNAGTVSLFRGSATDVIPVSVQVLEGTGIGDRFGRKVCFAGDVDGDGRPDLAVGIPFADVGGRPNTGSVGVFLSTGAMYASVAAQTLTGTEADDAFGSAVALLGDVNRDGISDLGVGAPNATRMARLEGGQASVFLGGPGGVRTTPAVTVDGAASSDYFGFSVVGVGDVDGDGFDDYAFGADGVSSSAGQVTVYRGSSMGLSTAAWRTFTGVTGDGLGAALAGAR